jgi:ATP-dependent Clp protease ATP-binding subunit ClpC
MDGNVVLKYCALLDEFVKIRVFTDVELKDLLRVAVVPNRTAYRQLVVNACIMDLSAVFLTGGTARETTPSREKVEDALYLLCVEVNPKLDIHQVTIPLVGREATREPVALIGEPRREPAAAAPRKLPFGLDRVATLGDALRRRVIGQTGAVETLARAVRKAAAGLRDPRKPIGSVLFVGKTGVGKTELARALAACLYGDDSKLIRVDCSEFALEHEYAKLIGAPPGYVGHNEGGQLTSRLRENGPGVVLFDEIEKAHTKIHNILLQVMDDGGLTDSKGQRVSFADSVLILTSNLGVEDVERWRNQMGFDSHRRDAPEAQSHLSENAVVRDSTLAAIRRRFSPEFVNRIDEVVVFNSLRRADCLLIVRNMLAELAAYARQNGVALQFTRRLRESLAKLGHSEEYGARELRRTIKTAVEDPLAERIVAGRIGRGNLVRVDFRDSKAVFVVR